VPNLSLRGLETNVVKFAFEAGDGVIYFSLLIPLRENLASVSLLWAWHFCASCRTLNEGGHIAARSGDRQLTL